MLHFSKNREMWKYLHVCSLKLQYKEHDTVRKEGRRNLCTCVEITKRLQSALASVGFWKQNGVLAPRT